MTSELQDLKNEVAVLRKKNEAYKLWCRQMIRNRAAQIVANRNSEGPRKSDDWR